MKRKKSLKSMSLTNRGESKLSKKKITQKHISPDISAAKVLLEHFTNVEENKYEQMSLDELRQEKLKLIKLLEQEGENDAS